MKIMQICFTELINSAGGVEKVFCNLANHFCQKHEVVGVCCDGKIGMPYYWLDDRVKLYDLTDKVIKNPLSIKIKSEIVRLFKQARILNCELPKNQYRMDLVQNKFSELVTKEKPDVIICYSVDILPLITKIGFDLSRTICMFHSAFSLKKMTDEQRMYLKQVKVIQVLLESAEKYMLDSGYQQTITIGNAIGTDEDISIDFDNREKEIVCVARLDKKVKQQHLLIQAFAKLAFKYPEWKVKIYGGNPVPDTYIDELKELINKGKMGGKMNVFLMGTCNNILDEIKKSSIFVLPSKGEGFPVALGEAMSVGLPVIGFKDATGVNSLIKNKVNGLLCESNIDALSNAIETLIKNKDLCVQFGKAGYEDMLQFKPNSIYQKWDEVIENFV